MTATPQAKTTARSMSTLEFWSRGAARGAASRYPTGWWRFFRISAPALFLASALTVATLPQAAWGQKPIDKNAPATFSADTMSQDKAKGIITASGHVEVNQDQRTLLADKIVYDQKNDLLSAKGHIILREPSGEVVFAKDMKISGDLKNGIVHNLRIVMKDKSRFAARTATLRENRFTKLGRAVYTACNACKKDPSRPPLWQVKAMEIFHDKKAQSVEYKDAWVEFAGVPIAYTPYLSHPDPSVKRRSGLLPPRFGGTTDLGATVETPYFYAISPSSDVTLRPIFTSKEGPVLAGDYRQRFRKGEINLDASLTKDSKKITHGHVIGMGRFDIDNTWRWGADLQRTTQDTYMRRYGLGTQNTLTSKIFAEGFRGRNYFSAKSYLFQSLRANDKPGSIPLVAPMLDYSHVSEPSRYGAYNTLDLSMVALTRSKSTDDQRFSFRSGWHLPYTAPKGDIYDLSATVQGDLYHVNGLKRTDGSTFTGYKARLHPQLAFDWRYPFVRQENRDIYQLIEPITSFVVAPYGGNPSSIPNEDSLDVEFDTTNLFSHDRFAGYDRVEGGPRVNYGIKWGVYGSSGGSTSVLFGQSYRLKADSTFAAGTGLNDRFSDYVGRVHIQPGHLVDLLYRTRIDKKTHAISRNEVRISAGTPAFNISSNYIYFPKQADSEYNGRKELSLNIKSQLSRYWRGSVSGVRDLQTGGGMRSTSLSLAYEDECFVFKTDVQRTYYQDREIQPSDAFVFEIVFKTLGSVRANTTR
ncbi:LPS-assembly protein LptD [Varunaivibrio sulfuroxidans]|uniref:LPS-assembly protein LptD n=1 Tax=Varunaivibrio sulfuroxidans TaxID=1773489 RepID=A0A4R3J5L8_9PROT|nr:LPS assembly protein LptD [Varunaivibrio sulfuroxidans]TCS60116.1 LPS-assembly protein [Varunaivibrio sulfuroxidans]WES30910.1 LPS assembly protein LptD [Varunaivibrio sulfuroxidans]